MKESVLAESIKAALNGKTVKTALFFTYNFDAAFFENYILPLCMAPNIGFGTNATQNAMLWIRYGKDLPSVGVICDYYAKNDSEPPSLNYEVACIALKNHCFHPKNIFLLCDDGDLLFFAGSANISYSGWCHNVEVMSMQKFVQSDSQDETAGSLRQYLESVRDLAAEASPKALREITTYFLRAKVATAKDSTCHFHHSPASKFFDFLRSLQDKHNHGLPFDSLEVVSPYLSQNAMAAQYGELASMSRNGVDLAVPWSNAGQASIAKNVFDELAAKGVRWRAAGYGGNDGQFRFTHAKLYRFKGAEKMITVAGSVNLTEKGFGKFEKRNSGSGNIESALAIVEPVENWKSIFGLGVPNPDYYAVDEEPSLDPASRGQIPALSFILDWGKKTLAHKYATQWGSTCRLQLRKGEKGPILRYPEGEVWLGDEDLERFSESCVVTVQEMRCKNVYCYFPRQENYAAKPVPPKLRISIPEIFGLWAHLGDEGDGGQELGAVISRVCDLRVNENGEIASTDTSVLTSMNLMAQHLAGIDYLHRYIFTSDNRLSSNCSADERKRLLFNDGLDTLPHYCRQLSRLVKDNKGRERFSLGFYWLVLSIVKKRFYIETNNWLKKDMEISRNYLDWLAGEIQSTRKTLAREQGVDNKLLAWAEAEI